MLTRQSPFPTPAIKNPYPITRPLLLGRLLASQACQYDAPRPTSKLASKFDAERQQEPVTRTVYVPATKSQAARQVEIRCYETWDYYYDTLSGEYLGKRFVSEGRTVSDDGSGGGDGGTGGGAMATVVMAIQLQLILSSILLTTRRTIQVLKPILYLDRCTGAQGDVR